MRFYYLAREKSRITEIKEAKASFELVKSLISQEFDEKLNLSRILLYASTNRQIEPDSLVNRISLQNPGYFAIVDSTSFQSGIERFAHFAADSSLKLSFSVPEFPNHKVLFETASIDRIVRQIAKSLDGKCYLLSDQGYFLANSDSLDNRKQLPHITSEGFRDMEPYVHIDIAGPKKDFRRFMSKVDLGDSGFLLLTLIIHDSVFYDDFQYVKRLILSLTAVGVVLIVLIITFSSFKYTRKELETSQVQSQLQLSDARLLSFIESPGEVSIFSLDNELKYTGFNSLHEKEMLEVFGAKVEKGLEILPMLPYTLSSAVKVHFLRALKGEHFTVTAMYRNNYYSQVYNPVYARFGGKSEIIGLTGNIFEVTEKIKADQEIEKYRDNLEEIVEARTKELSAQKDFFQNVIDQVPTLIFLRDNQGRYILANAAFSKSLGLQTYQLIDKTIAETHDDLKEAEQYLQEDLKILATDGVFEIENFQTKNTENDTWYFLTKKRIELDGKYYVLGVQNDITFLKHAEEHLQKTNKRLKLALNDLESTQERLLQSEKMASIGQLTAGLAHEINNPMNYVSGNIKPIRKDLLEVRAFLRESKVLENQSINDTFDEIEALIDAIDEGATRVNGLMSDLNSFSSKNRGEKSLSNILEPIESTINLVNHQVRDRIEFKFYNDEDLPLININIPAIKQVVLNVINNSIHAIADKGFIEIWVNLEEPNVVVRIIDNGIGIAPENISKVFNPFFTTKEVGEGSGLGLSISYNIMDEHGGRILLDSVVGEGTTVTLTFPI